MIFFTVLYNPGLNAIRNIEFAFNAGLPSVVYLNSVDVDFLDSIKRFEPIFLGDNTNRGLGRAFFDVEEYCDLVGVDYFFYLDQDTVLEASGWERLAREYSHIFDDSRIGMIQLCQKNTDGPFFANSGCIFPMRVVRLLGRHDPSYFVEGVDYEFCLRLCNAGYKVFQLVDDSIDHFSLQDVQVGRLFGCTFNYRIYGKRRHLDFNRSHYNLFFMSLKFRDFGAMFFLLKSFIAFNFNELRLLAFKRFF